MSVHSSIFWHNESDTEAFAKTLVASNDLSNAIVELRGDLGAGKTTLTRYLLQALGVTGRIKSPTYAIMETYSGNQSKYDLERDSLPISHFDFYRFNDPAEWEEAGFRDIFTERGLKIVEWAEKAKPMLPDPDFVIAIEMQADNSRRVTVSTRT
ncbi:MAG: tRNA ((37)-N6)-threonylcarbamoyltransferase complex ATPase subunit type 1 TsaE [Pseudomonadota bacterium]|jgi:tRNA threonylcarbamoyladenosine biosynthesis protein TsaE